MNINTTKTVLSVKDYLKDELKCQQSAWKYKFNNSWNECDTWCDYLNYYFLSDVLAQVYIIDSPNIPKNKKIRFALPVKTYDVNAFASFVFNKVERTTEGVKDFIVGTTFTTNRDIKPAYLTFYLNPDVKIPKEYILNKYRAIFLNTTTNLPVYITTQFYVNRNLLTNGVIKPTSKVSFIADRYLQILSNIKLSSSVNLRKISNKGYIYLTTDLDITAQSGLVVDRYINPVAKLNITTLPNLTATREIASNGLINTGSNTIYKVIRNIYTNGFININSSAVLQSNNCDIWDGWNTWDDYDIWSCTDTSITPIYSNGKINIVATTNIEAQRDLNIYSNTPINSTTNIEAQRNLNILVNIPITSTASLTSCCNCWGDFNTWGDRNTWLCN
jgi:hypothetical protein